MKFTLLLANFNQIIVSNGAQIVSNGAQNHGFSNSDALRGQQVVIDHSGILEDHLQDAASVVTGDDTESNESHKTESHRESNESPNQHYVENQIQVGNNMDAHEMTDRNDAYNFASTGRNAYLASTEDRRENDRQSGRLYDSRQHFDDSESTTNYDSESSYGHDFSSETKSHVDSETSHVDFPETSHVDSETSHVDSETKSHVDFPETSHVDSETSHVDSESNAHVDSESNAHVDFDSSNSNTSIATSYLESRIEKTQAESEGWVLVVHGTRSARNEGWNNGWDAQQHRDCGNQMIAGLYSEHWNHMEDRYILISY